ncbi:MAG TPA: hypothetical protein VGG74_21255 [Kofleriaceae bacterium]
MSGATGIAWDAILPAIQAWVMRGSGLDDAHVVYADQGSDPSGGTRPPRPSGPYISMRLTVGGVGGYDWYAREPNVLTVPTITVSAIDTGTSKLTATAHGRVTGDGPLELDASVTLPEPLVADQPLWAIAIDANTLQIAADFFDAMASPPVPITLESAGSGTITIVGTADTVRAGQEVTQHTQGPRAGTLELTAFAGAGGTGIGASSPLGMLDGVMTASRLESVAAALATAGVAVATFERPRSIGSVVNASEFEPRAFVTIALNLASSFDETSTYIERVTATGTIDNATVDIDTSD